MENKLVLDATCGSRMIWFNKNNEIAVFVDKRELDKVLFGKLDDAFNVTLNATILC